MQMRVGRQAPSDYVFILYEGTRSGFRSLLQEKNTSSSVGVINQFGKSERKVATLLQVIQFPVELEERQSTIAIFISKQCNENMCSKVAFHQRKYPKQKSIAYLSKKTLQEATR